MGSTFLCTNDALKKKKGKLALPQLHFGGEINSNDLEAQAVF